MTVFGWDASHFDGLLSPGVLARARAQGIVFFTHKLAEGLSDTEGGNDDTALAAARTAGIPFVGGYLIPRSNASVTAQVDAWLRLADQGEPWWRDHRGWFWQVDLERWPYDNVPAAVGIAAAQQLRARTGRWTILYASHSQYGDQLTAWDGPTWNADYVTRTPGLAATMYPGDDWRPSRGSYHGGWAPYSGREPTILQYTSSATIAGLTTCDANAFRGSIDQLRALITGGDPMDQAEKLIHPTPNAPGRDIGSVFTDTGNLRDYLIGAGAAVPGDPAWPKPDSPLGKLIEFLDHPPAAAVLSDEQMAELGTRIGAAVAGPITDLTTAIQKLSARLAAAGQAMQGG